MRDTLRAYITEEMIGDPDYPLQDDEPLWSAGLMDSFSLAQLAVFIEDEFGVHFDDVDLTVDKMDTINQVVAAIEARQ